jgi:hypothetical protein
MTITKSIAGIAAFVAMTWGGASIVAQAQTVGRNASGVDSYQFEIAATTQWIETKIDLRARNSASLRRARPCSRARERREHRQLALQFELVP